MLLTLQRHPALNSMSSSNFHCSPFLFYQYPIIGYLKAACFGQGAVHTFIVCPCGNLRKKLSKTCARNCGRKQQKMPRKVRNDAERARNSRNYLQKFEEGLRLPAASSVKRIRVDTPIPIALHITSEPVPLFLQRFGTWPSSGNNNEYRGSHTRAVYTQSVAPKKDANYVT